MENLRYFCDPSAIEDNALQQVIRYAQNPHIEKVCAFTDIHFCEEKAVPVGVAFTTRDYFYPLITGKDIGCGVMFLRISKEDWIRPYDKSLHYRAWQAAQSRMTDDGLGGGNHFLSLEEDENFVYIICHTGTRDRGIGLYQHCYGLVQDFSREWGSAVSFVHRSFVDDAFFEYYENTLRFGYQRRKNFCLKTLAFLQNANYIRSQKTQIPRDYLTHDFSNWDEEGVLHVTPYLLSDSVHNHIRFGAGKDDIVHRKGSTELLPGRVVVIPLSMTRGSLLVTLTPYHPTAKEALLSCAHGAGRRLSRYEAMKHWKTGLKEKERKAYQENFPEMLDRSGRFSSGYIQEFDFAYKGHSEIFQYQPYLKKVTETKPIATIKYTEI